MRYADFCLDWRRNRLLCVREDHSAGRRGGQHDRGNRPAGRRTGRGAGRATTSTRTPGSTHPASGSLAVVAAPEHALGWHRTVGGATSRRTATWRTPASLRAAPASRSSSPNGRRRACCTSSRTATAGGTCTGSSMAGRALCPMEAEFGQPQWVFGMTTYGFADEDDIVCAYKQKGTWHILRLHPESRSAEDVPLDVHRPVGAESWTGLRGHGRGLARQALVGRASLRCRAKVARRCCAQRRRASIRRSSALLSR